MRLKYKKVIWEHKKVIWEQIYCNRVVEMIRFLQEKRNFMLDLSCRRIVAFFFQKGYIQSGEQAHIVRTRANKVFYQAREKPSCFLYFLHKTACNILCIS